jgi:hypothetical protein
MEQVALWWRRAAACHSFLLQLVPLDLLEWAPANSVVVIVSGGWGGRRRITHLACKGDHPPPTLSTKSNAVRLFHILYNECVADSVVKDWSKSRLFEFYEIKEPVDVLRGSLESQ